ncbi:extracellular solute-binding protein [Streptomyces aidingensis]|uniref:Raffinose/stachyose/melibiose transport system substrate-binding protein n=1 Tax=Streptomyces aidingensis TaxID=910347 RepID=A0A1I1UXY3_9ACTN|nr:extracellular solute-binding protein [Streptomyces aidingensis]SFD75544.1 raffinose/stachyose/melibiose transport system substrate-binding protein [Streptomyces aidingensis]
MSLRRRSLMGLAASAAASALVLSACGGDDGGESADGNVTVEWWHIGTAEPNKSLYADWAKEYETANPGVKIKITEMENEAFKSKMTTQLAAGDLPDIFSTWGGGVLAQQVEAGLVKDLSEPAADTINTMTEAALSAYQIDGKTYGLPIDAGMVGFWYNKALFAEAGIEAPPATWTEFLDAVQKLKDADITPIALAGKEKWPGHFYWTYLAMRMGGLQMLQDAAESNDFTAEGFVQAGEKLQELADLEPFQEGFMGADYSTPDGQAALVGSGKAAMELMGQWAPSVEKDAGGGIGEDLAFFPFPEVEGGVGSGTEVLGGGNGFAVAEDAPDEAVDFLAFISEREQQAAFAESGAGLPVLQDSVDLVQDANLKVVAETVATSTGFQLYLDQAYAPAVGGQVNDSVAELLGGTATPEQVTEAITATAQAEG